MTKKIEPGSTYQRFDPPRHLAGFRGHPGLEIGDQLLSPAALTAISDSAAGGPCELVAIGAWTQPDGRRHLDLGVSRAWIEATTNWRHPIHADGKTDPALSWRCPDCGLWGDKHAKTCGT